MEKQQQWTYYGNLDQIRSVKICMPGGEEMEHAENLDIVSQNTKIPCLEK